jgi:fructose-1-phosphate kinase PfkB-like protein
MADVHQAALELLEMGAQNVLVSLGGEGALWVSESGAMFTPAIPVRVQSTVGAGDAMVGGVMTGLEKTGDVRHALAYGAAAGCASVMTEGTQLIRPDDFAALLPQVQIQDV